MAEVDLSRAQAIFIEFVMQAMDRAIAANENEERMTHLLVGRASLELLVEDGFTYLSQQLDMPDEEIERFGGQVVARMEGIAASGGRRT